MEDCLTDSKGRRILSPRFYDETIASIQRSNYKSPDEDESLIPHRFLTFYGSREHFQNLYDFEDFRMAVILLNHRVAEIRGMIDKSKDRKVSLRGQQGRNIEIKSLDYVFFPVDFHETSKQSAEHFDNALQTLYEDFSKIITGKLIVVVLDPVNAIKNSMLKGVGRIDLGYFLSGKTSH